MEFPQDFTARERALLGDRFNELYAYATPQPARGVTVNALRCTPDWFAKHMDFVAEPSKFCPAAFTTAPDFRPGRHPWHHAGVLYAQEPSASAPAALLDVQPGMRVADLCAAPGGKTSQLAAALQGRGLLLANEFVAARAEILRQNLERMGVANAIITNEDTARLAAAMPGRFDRVLVDAPCSGEGMFRKEAAATAQHNDGLVAHCAELGAEILENAAALLAPGRRVEALAAYAGGCVTGALCVQPPGNAFSALLSAGAGLGVVCFLPRQWLTPAGPEEPPGETPQEERPRLSVAATRLEAVAESLSSLAETVNEVYDAFPRRCENFRWVIDNTHDTLCANCGRRESCWKQEYAATLEGMEALRPVLEQQGHLEPNDLPGQLSRCIHPAALCATATRSFALYRSRKEARVHAEALRTALTEQYSAVADALGVLSEQLGRPGTPEPYKSGRVASFFTSLGAPPLECSVTLDDLGRTRAAVTLPRTRFSPAELAALAREVSGLCRRAFEPPQVLSCKGMTTLLFSEKPALRAVFGAAGVAARGTISGDAVQQFCSPAAAQMILCDGMGTGRPAAVDGNLAAELTARLLKAGFTAELAARLVNVALALKSDEESGATLDLISVDLYTGTARLFKAGAAPGFLVHGGRARAVGDVSLPMGILGGVNGQSRMVHLAAGDYAVLVSDGLLVDGPGWVVQQLELSAAAGDAPEKIARTLVETARARAEKAGRPDDITAAVLRLEPC